MTEVTTQRMPTIYLRLLNGRLQQLMTVVEHDDGVPARIVGKEWHDVRSVDYDEPPPP